MDSYAAIYVLLLAFLAVGNAAFCFTCARNQARARAELRQEQARCRALETQVRNLRNGQGDLARARKGWVAGRKDGASH